MNLICHNQSILISKFGFILIVCVFHTPQLNFTFRFSSSILVRSQLTIRNFLLQLALCRCLFIPTYMCFNLVLAGWIKVLYCSETIHFTQNLSRLRSCAIGSVKFFPKQLTNSHISFNDNTRCETRFNGHNKTRIHNFTLGPSQKINAISLTQAIKLNLFLKINPVSANEMISPAQSLLPLLIVLAGSEALTDTSSSLNDGKLKCWNHHCEYGEEQILCYRPLYTCDIRSDGSPLDASLRCIKSSSVSEGYTPRPDLYCASDFISDCTCAHRKTGAAGDQELSERTEHAYCKCEMNYRARSIVVFVVVVLILVVGVIVGVVFGYIKLMDIQYTLKIKARKQLESHSTLVKPPAFVKETGDSKTDNSGNVAWK